MKLDELYFGVMRINFNTGKLEQANLFGSLKVLRSVALYATRKSQLHYFEKDPLSWCFADVRCRCEYEMLVSDLTDCNFEKYDLYELYVKPNAELLMKLVNSVDPKDARKWLQNDNKRR